MSNPLGVVAAGHPLTAEAAGEILRAGGNAYDAALAAMAAACVTEPVLASPGGGGFLLAHPAGAKARVYDFFVHTPALRRPAAELDFYEITADFGTAQQEFHIGRGTVAVPGLVRGLFEIHRDLASMPMREILAPAIGWARDGVSVTDYQGYLFGVVRATFLATDAVRVIYASRERPDATIGSGERLVQRDLADVLDVLAAEGADLFYRGEIAATIARDMRAGGQITRADLEGYAVARREPLALDVAGARVLTNPPPAAGGALVAFGLALLDAVGLEPRDFGTVAHLDPLARALALTIEGRRRATGADGAPLDADALLDPAFVARCRTEVAGRARAARGTTQVSVIDAAGNLASATVSNGEGSGYVVPGTGIVLNNMLGEEDLNPGGFQRWSPGERMSSMMAPSALLEPDGGRVATGSGGSNRIRSAVLQVLLDLLAFRMPLEAAVEAPRIHLEGGLLSVEGGFEVGRLGPLLEAYPEHRLWPERNMFFGGAHSVAWRGGRPEGAGDPRRGGASVVVG